MTPARLAEIRALADGATRGPWAYRMGDVVQLTDAGKGYPLDYYPDSKDVISQDRDGDLRMSDADAEFVAMSRSAVPELIEEVERLRSLVWQIDSMLQVPAAEYVPAIADVFKLIDDAALSPAGLP